MDKRHFIVTAGHCVRDSQRLPMAFGVLGVPHRFTPTLGESSYRLDEWSDYGFWEIPSDHAGEFAYRRRFVDPSRIELLNGQCIRGKVGTPALSGYPGKLTEGDWSKNPTSHFLSYTTVVAGVDGAPKSAFPSPPSEERPAMDLWVGQQNIGALPSVPLLQGASGGGYWWIEPWEKGSALPEDHYRLAAIHAKSYSDPGTGERFARGYLIENHLRLIGETYPVHLGFWLGRCHAAPPPPSGPRADRTVFLAVVAEDRRRHPQPPPRFVAVPSLRFGIRPAICGTTAGYNGQRDPPRVKDLHEPAAATRGGVRLFRRCGQSRGHHPQS